MLEAHCPLWLPRPIALPPTEIASINATEGLRSVKLKRTYQRTSERARRG